MSVFYLSVFSFLSVHPWPLTTYAVYIYNHTPNANTGIAPINATTRTCVPRQQLMILHMWGSPVYVLKPRLQDGKKIPRWEPKSCRGLFLDFSRTHATSTIPLVLHLNTLNISAQFHVVFEKIGSLL